ncbi:MAG: ATP-binding protein [Methanobrevibacter sp.]|nr:ATP-binding protein [Methanobrevibacter sp.]
MVKYLKRIIDDDLDKYLEMIGAILIIGPKWCGKTTTAERHAKSVLKLQDKDQYQTNMMWADIEPSRLLRGDKPRLIDEWQIAPVLWDSVRTSVDETDGYGLYILTGSTVVNEDGKRHTGTGRIHRLIMRTMSLYESGESNGQISIMDLFDNPEMNINEYESELTMDELIFAACRGGWPESLNQKTREGKLFVAYAYLDNICNTDASAVDGVKRDPDRVRLLLRSIARNNSTLAKDQTIIDDMKANFMDISRPTYYSYVDALKRLFVLEDQRGWSPNIKSKSAIRSGNKKVFIDPSIAVAALHASPESMEKDLKTFGFVFENLCIRDLNVYTSSHGGKVSYYHDKSDLEIDCVVHLKDGRYALIECKLVSERIEDGAKNLLKINELIEKNDKLENPTFLAVLTGGKYAYTRPDGVKVIPIGCLK